MISSPVMEESSMSAITTTLFSSSGREQLARSRDPISHGRFAQAQTETQTSADFTFLTAEGDKVTLSADTLLQASYTRYDARGTLLGQNAQVQGEALALSATQHSSIAVEGHLSQQEIEDIQHIVQKVAELAHDVFSGTRTEPLDVALDLEDFETLRSFNATLEYTQTSSLTEVFSQRRQEVAHSPSSASAAAVATAPTATQPERLYVPQPRQDQGGVFGNPRQLLHTIRQALQAQNNPSTVAHRQSGDIFRSIADTLSDQVTAAGTARQQGLSDLAAQFLQRLRELEQPETSAAASPSAATPSTTEHNPTLSTPPAA